MDELFGHKDRVNLEIRKLCNQESIKRSEKREEQGLRNDICHCQSTARSALVLHFTMLNGFSFFDDTDPFEIHRCIMMVPEKAMYHLVSEVCQDVSHMIGGLYANLDRFADRIIEYFALDLSGHLVFAYSTFPSLFGLFSSEELCERAGYAMQSLIRKKAPAVLVSALISAFFFSAHVFWYVFFAKLSEMMDECLSEVDVSEMILAAVRHASAYLCRSHCEVLRDFEREYGSAEDEAVVGGIVMAQLSMRSQFGAMALSPVEIVVLTEAVDRNGVLRSLLDIVITQQQFLGSVPFTVCDTHGSLLVVLSNRDVVTLAYITKSDRFTDGELLERYGDKYTPFCVDVFLSQKCRPEDPTSLEYIIKMRECRARMRHWTEMVTATHECVVQRCAFLEVRKRLGVSVKLIGRSASQIVRKVTSKIDDVSERSLCVLMSLDFMPWGKSRVAKSKLSLCPNRRDSPGIAPQWALLRGRRAFSRGPVAAIISLLSMSVTARNFVLPDLLTFVPADDLIDTISIFQTYLAVDGPVQQALGAECTAAAAHLCQYFRTTTGATNSTTK